MAFAIFLALIELVDMMGNKQSNYFGITDLEIFYATFVCLGNCMDPHIFRG